jgi:Prokaryotic N-terminal methylation motif
MSRKRGQTLIGLIVTFAIIAILAAVLYGSKGFGLLGSAVSPASAGPVEAQQGRKDGKGETVIGKVKYAAKDDVCRNGLSQARAGIAIATDPVDGTRPSALEEIRIGSTFYKCPVGGEPYNYDPKTGTVQCPHAGHEQY